MTHETHKHTTRAKKKHWVEEWGGDRRTRKQNLACFHQEPEISRSITKFHVVAGLYLLKVETHLADTLMFMEKWEWKAHAWAAKTTRRRPTKTREKTTKRKNEISKCFFFFFLASVAGNPPYLDPYFWIHPPQHSEFDVASFQVVTQKAEICQREREHEMISLFMYESRCRP